MSKVKCVPCRDKRHTRECCKTHCPTCRQECKGKTVAVSYRIEECTILASFAGRKRVQQ